MLGHWSEPASSSSGHIALRSSLQILDPIWRLLIGKRLHLVFRLVEFCFLDFEPAEAEAGYRLRDFALPHGHILPALVALADSYSRGSNLHAFGNAKGHVIGRVLPKRAAGIVRIPVHSGHGKIIASAFVGHRLLASILGGDRNLLIPSQCFWQNHGELSIIVLAFLHEGQRLPIACGAAAHPDSPEQPEA